MVLGAFNVGYYVGRKNALNMVLKIIDESIKKFKL